MFNKLLLRQVSKCYGHLDNVPEGLGKFLQIISDSYDHFEKDRKMLERSIELTSNEMVALNEKLREETRESNKRVFSKLKESLSLLKTDIPELEEYDADFSKLQNIADLLKEESQKRRAIEQELIKREANLKSSQRIAQIGSWELQLDDVDDLDENNLFWSDETFRIFGFEPGSVTVSNELFFSRVHPDDVSLIKNAVARTLQTGEVYDIDHRLLLPDGTQKFVREIGEVIKDPDSGKYVKILGAVQDITERVKAKSKLQRANNDLKVLFENIAEVFFAVDMVAYQVLQISQACYEVYGYTADEFKASPNLWYDVILEEDKYIVDNNNAPMYQGNAIDQEYRIRHKNGEIRWLQTRMNPTLNENGALVRLDGISIDITKRKEAELAVIEREHKFRALIENSADAIMIIDETSEVLYASDSLYRIMGYEKGEVDGLPTLRHIYHEDIDAIKHHLQKVLDNPRTPFSIIYRRVKKDGTVIWCEGIAQNMIDDPYIGGIVINFRDITERFTAEQALRQSEQKFRALIENSSDVISVVDGQGNNVFASNSIYRVTGFTPQETLQSVTFNFIYPDDVPLLREHMAKVLSRPGETLEMTYRRYKKDRSVIWCEGRATNLLDDESVRGIVINFRDITERKEYIEKLTVTNEHLAKTNMELDKFVYHVSHDLRAPLSSMLGVVELAQADTDSEEMLEYLGMLEKSINKLDGFILDILDYSKNSRMKMNPVQIDFEERISEVIDNLRYMSNEKGNVDIQINIKPHPGFHSDKSRINIVLSNLISNAIRYRDSQKDTSIVSISVAPEGETDVKISVKDNGIGIAPDKIGMIFDMFYRVSKKSQGSGIGLYIVKETVEKLHGHIQVISEQGKGSEFIITLPDLGGL